MAILRALTLTDFSLGHQPLAGVLSVNSILTQKRINNRLPIIMAPEEKSLVLGADSEAITGAVSRAGGFKSFKQFNRQIQIEGSATTNRQCQPTESVGLNGAQRLNGLNGLNEERSD